MEENRKSARLVSRFHAPAAKQPNERLRAATGEKLLVLSRGLFENTLHVLSERSAGWRESGSMNPDGSPANLSGRTGYSGTNVDLSGVNTRAKVFAGWNSGAGWVPTP